MMEPQHFSVLINSGSDTAVRIDGLRSEYAIRSSGVFCTLFSLPDSEEVQRIQRGEPILLNLTCYNADLTLADSISVSVLHKVFNLFSSMLLLVGDFDFSLDDYCHGLQILSFLDVSTTFGLFARVDELREIVKAILPFCRNFSRDLQLSIGEDLGVILAQEFYSDYISLDPICQAVMFMVLNGAEYDLAVESVRGTVSRRAIGEIFCRWRDTEIALRHVPAYATTVENLVQLDDGVNLGFLFSYDGKEAEPAGIFVLRFEKRDSGTRREHHLFSRRLKGGDWSENRIFTLCRTIADARDTVGDSLWVMSPHCVTSDNLYQDEIFVQRVFEALGTTLNEIRESYRAANK